MILTILRIMYLRLRNNPLELLLTFVMPVVFFSIFSAIFSRGIAAGSDKKLRVGWIALSETRLSNELKAFLGANSALECRVLEVGEEEIEAGIAEAQRSGRYDMIVRVPKGFPATLAVEHGAGVFEVQLLTDGQNPMAVAMVTTVVQGFFAAKKASVTAEQLLSLSTADRSVGSSRSTGLNSAAGERTYEPEATEPAVRADRGSLFADRQPAGDLQWFKPVKTPVEFFKNAEDPGWPSIDADGFLSMNGLADVPEESLLIRPEEERAVTTVQLLDEMTARKPVADSKVLASGDVVTIRVENPQAANQENPRIAMYAAGIAVLFLLFSSTGNAAALLEEAESGTLDRILIGKAGLFHLIAGKWLGIFVLGCVQIIVMFLWAELVFRIQLWGHLDGFAVMTVCTAASTSSFAMLMATLCRTRTQLNAVSVVVILSMSAVGGSMIPRFVMSDRMKQIGQWTFNAWALDGYQKVFWYQSPVVSLRMEVLVLLGSAFILGLLALLLSHRWKRG